MRKITSELFCTLDGVVSSPDKWHGPFHDNGVSELIEAGMAAADTMLLGRNTYLEHVGYWPEATGSMADLMNGIPKIVVSASLEKVAWQNTTLLTGDVTKKVSELKEQSSGGPILITGSVALVKTLMGAGLLNELRLIVDPIVVGEGTRLFDPVTESATFALVDVTRFDTGAIALTYGTA